MKGEIVMVMGSGALRRLQISASWYLDIVLLSLGEGLYVSMFLILPLGVPTFAFKNESACEIWGVKDKSLYPSLGLIFHHECVILSKKM